MDGQAQMAGLDRLALSAMTLRCTTCFLPVEDAGGVFVKCGCWTEKLEVGQALDTGRVA